MSRFTESIEKFLDDKNTEFNFNNWFILFFFAKEPNKLELLQNAIKNNPSLDSLNIGPSGDDEYFYPIIDALFQKPILTLQLNVGLISIKHAEYLAKTIKENKFIKSLILCTSRDVGEEDESAVLKALDGNISLEELTIKSENNIKPSAIFVKEISKYLPKTSLSTLYFPLTEISDEGMSEIVKGITNSRLKKLVLFPCHQIGQQTLLQFAEMLKINKVLEVLELYALGGSIICDESAYLLANALKFNESLSLLNLGTHVISKPAVEAIISACKSTGIIVTGPGIKANIDFTQLTTKFNTTQDPIEKAILYLLVSSLDESKLSPEMQGYVIERREHEKLAAIAPALLNSKRIYVDGKQPVKADFLTLDKFDLTISKMLDNQSYVGLSIVLMEVLKNIPKFPKLFEDGSIKIDEETLISLDGTIEEVGGPIFNIDGSIQEGVGLSGEVPPQDQNAE